jgi:hypothetical protein
VVVGIFLPLFLKSLEIKNENLFVLDFSIINSHHRNLPFRLVLKSFDNCLSDPYLEFLL